MSDPKFGDLTVRVVAVGHASARWKSARTPAEADRNNVLLSDMRAKNVRTFMEEILKRELPSTMQIGVAPMAVGRFQALWPEKPVDDFAINRSVVVTIETTTTTQHNVLLLGKRRIAARTNIWSVRVLGLARLGLGVNGAVITIALKNPITGKEMTGTAILLGGGSVDISSKGNPADLMKQVGKTGFFTTPEAMGFDDFDGTAISAEKLKLRIIYGNEMMALKFPFLHHDPDQVVFDYEKGFGWGADVFYMSGKLSLEGKNPGDYYEVLAPGDMVQLPHRATVDDGLLVSFPTGKAGLHDLTSSDRNRLADFTTQKARAIAHTAKYLDVSAAHP